MSEFKTPCRSIISVSMCLSCGDGGVLCGACNEVERLRAEKHVDGSPVTAYQYNSLRGDLQESGKIVCQQQDEINRLRAGLSEIGNTYGLRPEWYTKKAKQLLKGDA